MADGRFGEILSSLTMAALQSIRRNAANNGFEAYTPSTVTLPIAESDVTNLVSDLAAKQPLDTQLTSLAALSYGGNALKVVRVNAGETDFELATAGGAGSSATTVETNLGSTAKTNGKFTITDAAIGATSKVLCWQAPGPYTGKGTLADEAEIQPIRVISVEPAAGSAVVKWECPPMVTMSVEVIDGKRDAVGATFDRLVNQRSPVQLYPKRIGKARGNVKFSYMVLA